MNVGGEWVVRNVGSEGWERMRNARRRSMVGRVYVLLFFGLSTFNDMRRVTDL